jgi:hypothetical protein
VWMLIPPASFVRPHRKILRGPALPKHLGLVSEVASCYQGSDDEYPDYPPATHVNAVASHSGGDPYTNKALQDLN